MDSLPNWPLDAERDYWRRACVDDFGWFFRYAWGYDFNPKGAAGPRPWFFKQSHQEACDWYQHHALDWLAHRRAGDGIEKKLLVIVPRDWGKTTLFTQAGQAWLHIHDPELATYTGAETMSRCKEVLSGIKAVISGDDKYSRFSWLYGNQRHTNRVWKLDSVVTAARTNLTRRDASFGSWAVQTGMVGLHPDACFFDDPNTYEKMQSKSDWLKIVVRHVDSLIPVFQSDAFWCLTGTRYGDGDHLGSAIKKEGVASITGMTPRGVTVREDGIWHLFFMDAENDDYPESDSRHWVMPKIWGPGRVKSFKRRNMTRYYAQVRNDPTLSPYNTLTFDQCYAMVKPVDSDAIKKLRLSFHLDTAFKSENRKTDGDYSVISVVGHMTDGTARCVFLGAFASQDSMYGDYGAKLIEMVKHWRSRAARISALTDEPELGGKLDVWPAWLENLFKTNHIPMPTFHQLSRTQVNKKAGSDKYARIREAAGHWVSGKMILAEGAENLDMLIEQMVKLGKTEHDDVADATADAFNGAIYSTIYTKDTLRTDDGLNPFDEVLKPGRKGDDAAELIAKAVDDKLEFWTPQRWDVVCP